MPTQITNKYKINRGNNSNFPAVGEDQLQAEVTKVRLSITKTKDKDQYYDGDTIKYTITVSHTSESEADATDVVIVDTMPAEITNSTIGYTVLSGPTPSSVDIAQNNTVTITIATLGLTETSQIELEGTINLP